jgi:hypothetical protein
VILALILPACAAPAPTPDLAAYEAAVIARVVATLTAGAPTASAAAQPSPTSTRAPTVAPTRPSTSTPTHSPAPTHTPTSTFAPTQSPPATPTPSPTAQLVVPFDRSFEADGWTWRLEEVQKAHVIPDGAGSNIAQGAFLLVFVEFKNRANALRRPNSLTPLYLLDANGYWRSLPKVESPADDAATAAAGLSDAGLFRDILSPGEKQIAVAVWDLPAGSGDLFLLLGNHRIYLGDFDTMEEADIGQAQTEARASK